MIERCQEAPAGESCELDIEIHLLYNTYNRWILSFIKKVIKCS